MHFVSGNILVKRLSKSNIYVKNTIEENAVRWCKNGAKIKNASKYPLISREKTRMIPICLEKRYRVVNCISIRFTMYFFGNKNMKYA